MSLLTDFMLEGEEGEQRLLTLKEIAPKWAERFEQRKELPFPLSLTWLKWYFELDHPAKCVVGEAYGNRTSYQKECVECDRLGWEFGGSFLLHSKTGLQRNINTFLKHWNEMHTPTSE
jgi:hypothetical protein